MLTDDEFAKHMRALRGISTWIPPKNAAHEVRNLWQILGNQYESKLPSPATWLASRTILATHLDLIWEVEKLPEVEVWLSVTRFCPGPIQAKWTVTRAHRGGRPKKLTEEEAIRRINAYRR